MSAIFDRGRELVKILNDYGIPATMNPDAAITGASVLITPPRITSDTAHAVNAEWKFVAVASGAGDEASWGRCDALIFELIHLVKTDVLPGTWEDANAGAWLDAPIYALTYLEAIAL